MKKLLLISTIVLIAITVSACSKPKSPNNLITNTNSSNNIKILNNTKKVDNTKSNNKTMNTEIKILDNQENLLKEYSRAIIKTSLGNITVKFYSDDSPITVNNFLNLAKEGFYNNTKFHRVIKGFMIQGGDPNSKEGDASTWGMGGAAYKFADEFNQHKLVEGSLAMANSGPNTNSSQFFIVTASSTPWLDGHHTNFGKVVDGLDVVHKIENVKTAGPDRPIKPVTVKEVELLK